MANFMQIFKPNENTKIRRTINILNTFKESLQNKTCLTCKHYKPVKELDMGYITSKCICDIHHRSSQKQNTCKQYIPCNIRVECDKD